MTPPAPPRDSPAGRAFNDLRNLAKREGRDPFEYYTLYALEGFLARMAASPQADHFVLKGGVLMAAFAARRPTRDIDVAASGIPGDVSDVLGRVGEIVAEGLEDGLDFDDGSLRAEEIRQEAAYAGVRVHMVASLASARIPLHVDVNFGDPIWPGATQAILPRLLGGTLTVRGYPDHMVLAEKIVTAVDRGPENTRWRDFVDIASITATRTPLPVASSQTDSMSRRCSCQALTRSAAAVGWAVRQRPCSRGIRSSSARAGAAGVTQVSSTATAAATPDLIHCITAARVVG